MLAERLCFSAVTGPNLCSVLAAQGSALKAPMPCHKRSREGRLQGTETGGALGQEAVPCLPFGCHPGLASVLKVAWLSEAHAISLLHA